VIDLTAVYRDPLRPWSQQELEPRYRDALRRGEQDLPPADPGTRPIGLLATVIPRLNSLAVASYAMHALPRSNLAEGDALHAAMLEIVDAAAAGSLLRCHLALDAELKSSDQGILREEDRADDWLPVIFDDLDDALHGRRADDDPPPASELAGQATVWVARAIDLIDQHHPDRTAAIADALGRLLAASIFADLARAQRLK
jgi:hypothetical protein